MKAGTALALAILTAALVPGTAASDPEPSRLLVETEGLAPGELEAGLASADATLVRHDTRLETAVVLGEVVPLTAAFPGRVRPDAEAFLAAGPNDPRWSSQWGPQFLDMPTAWDLEGGARSVLVGVVDSGLDRNHEDLAAVPVTSGWDYVDDDANALHDPHGHGTHVAGIIAAERGNGKGIAGMAKVSLHITRVFGPDNTGSCFDMASAIAEAAAAGARVINLSGFCSVPGIVEEGVVFAQSEGALVVAVTANWWTLPDDPVVCLDPGNLAVPLGCTVSVGNCLLGASPGSAPGVLAIAAIDRFGDPAPFSCRGPYTDLAAPGRSVLSTVPGGYGSKSGTSMAAPHVTGAAALLLSARPDLTDVDLRTILLATADDAGSPGWDPAYGHGVLDPVGALGMAACHPLCAP